MADLREKVDCFSIELDEAKNTGNAFEQAYHLTKMVNIQKEVHKTMSAIIEALRADLDMADLSERLESMKTDISAVENMVRMASVAKRSFGEEEEVFTRDIRRRVSVAPPPNDE